MDPSRRIDLGEWDTCGLCHVAHLVVEMSEPVGVMRGLICEACERELAAEAEGERDDGCCAGACCARCV